MKFNKLAKELDLSVSQLSDKVTSIIPNANGGTEVSETQKTTIIALLTKPAPKTNNTLSFLERDGTDPILSILSDRLEREAQLETPEQLVDEMIARYVKDPEDLPNDPDYREAIITLVDIVKKRQKRRQQQSSRLRSLLRQQGTAHSTTEPFQLESFYSNEPTTTADTAKLNGNTQPPTLSAASA